MTAWNGTPDEPERWAWPLYRPGDTVTASLHSGTTRVGEIKSVETSYGRGRPLHSYRFVWGGSRRGQWLTSAQIHTPPTVAISALPLPNPDALAAAIAEAVERALKNVAAVLLATLPPDLSRERAVDILREAAEAQLRTRPTGGGSGT